MNKVLVSVALLFIVIPLVGSEQGSPPVDWTRIAVGFSGVGSTKITKKENDNTITYSQQYNGFNNAALKGMVDEEGVSHQLKLVGDEVTIPFILVKIPKQVHDTYDLCGTPLLRGRKDKSNDNVACTLTILVPSEGSHPSTVTFILPPQYFDELRAQHEGSSRRLAALIEKTNASLPADEDE